ncbi:MAG: N-carbamoylputrescine amidase [Alphaproteobacteria bacterium]|nr:N-carbamoylputrescine amidase [Alphaproteobacteria bacterium]
MNETVSVAALQLDLSGSMEHNIEQVEALLRQAASEGAQIILPPELFQGPYFCKTQEEACFDLAYPAERHPCVEAMRALAEELGVVIPVSIFERDGPHYYNSVVMLDAGGKTLGVYRKSHIPDGPGYQEKFYFRPGDTGFKVWDTRFGRIGVGICWDQWFPEAARIMTLMGAEVLLYPTAIGAEPQHPELDTAARWQRAMQGHAVSNVIPVVAANRIGDEDGQVFYGSSFVCDHTGAMAEVLDRESAGIAMARFDRAAVERDRAAWGFFRDRRTDLYAPYFRS